MTLAIHSGQPVRKEFLVFGSPRIEQEEIDSVAETLRSGWVSRGPKVKKFEEDFEAYTGAKHALALNSCTAALHLALHALGIGPGDEVITTPMTFCATANVICHVGATPVFADVERDTMNIDPAKVEAAITPRTKAIIPVHLAGRPCDMDALQRIADKHNIRIVEDAAHAIEAICQGKKVGNISTITAFSFYVTKNICTGEGGMVTTNDPALHEKMTVMGLHGMSKHAHARFTSKGFAHYDVLGPGFKYNMMDVQAAMGIPQLRKVEEYWKRRDEIWARYDAAFKDLPVFLPAPVRQGDKHSRHLYTLMLDLDNLEVSRDHVLTALQAENIGVGVHYRALHEHPYYQKRFGFKPEDFPNTHWISERTISIPLSAKLTDKDVEDVIAAVRKVLLVYRK